MKRIVAKNKVCWIAIAVMAVLFSSAVYAEVDIEYVMDSTQWQRNGVYDLTVRIHNKSASAVNIAGVQADYNYASADFKDIAPMLIEDYITGYDFAVDQVDTATEGVVLYSKLIAEAASPNYFTLGGNATKDVVKFRYRVAAGASLEESNFAFRNTATVLERLAAGGTGSGLGARLDGTITIAEDTTPPNTYAAPASRTMKYGDSTKVALKEVAEPAYDDLQMVYYAVGVGTIPDPTVGGDWVAKDGMVQLPENGEGHPGSIAVMLKFFGRDTTGNLESPVHTENYTVDVIKPGFTSAPERSPDQVKLGEKITVEFTVNETLGSYPVVTVDGQAFTRRTASGNYYKYDYTVQGGEAEGNRVIRIDITDQAGNQTINTGLRVIIDMTPPTFTPVSFLPTLISAGQTLTITFTASEALQTTGSAAAVVTVAPGYDGGDAQYQSTSGLRYTYTYQVTGNEKTTFIRVCGSDLAGNRGCSTDGWGDIAVEGYDQYGNWGRSTGDMDVKWSRETYN